LSRRSVHARSLIELGATSPREACAWKLSDAERFEMVSEIYKSLAAGRGAPQITSRFQGLRCLRRQKVVAPALWHSMGSPGVSRELLEEHASLTLEISQCWDNIFGRELVLDVQRGAHP